MDSVALTRDQSVSHPEHPLMLVFFAVVKMLIIVNQWV